MYEQHTLEHEFCMGKRYFYLWNADLVCVFKNEMDILCFYCTCNSIIFSSFSLQSLYLSSTNIHV